MKEGGIPLLDIEMVWIEPGTFQMGSPLSEPGRKGNEGSPREVTISKGFYIGKYEVTQEQWESVMGTRPWQGQPGVRSGSDYPAVYMSWYDTQEFIRRLNTSLDLIEYRLPTETQWEYACRAGTTTRWSFGDDESQLGDYAWYIDNAEWYGHKVGTKRANPWGLYDMHGNVAEWVQNLYFVPSWPFPQRVVRGGRFDSAARHVRSANRSYANPYGGSQGGWPFIGFRVVRQAK